MVGILEDASLYYTKQLTSKVAEENTIPGNTEITIKILRAKVQQR